MLMDSCSLTPPVSPTSLAKAQPMFQPKELRDIVKIPCFSCKSSFFGSLHESCENYLDGGYFKKFLNREVLFKTSSTTILLFNRPFSVESALLEDSGKLFGFTKKQFNTIKILLNPNDSLDIDDEEIPKIRLQICSFLAFVKNFLLRLQCAILEKRVISSGHNSVIQFPQLRLCLTSVLRELKEMLFFVRRPPSIRDAMMSMYLICEKRNSMACYHYYHLGLDMWWSALECFHIINNICTVMSVDHNIDVFHTLAGSSKMYFDQVMNMVIWDLCSLGLKVYRTSNFDSSPFTCSCINQFWIQLMTLLDKQYETTNEKAFWLKLFSIFQHAIQNNHSLQGNPDNSIEGYFSFENDQLKHDNLPEFLLWLTYHIAPLYKYDTTGDYLYTRELKSCYLIPKYLIESVLNQDYNQKNELCLREMLIHFLGLAKQWEPTGDILLPLTDFYIKKIDDTFIKSKLEIQCVSYIFKSSSTWFDWLKNITSESTIVSATETSFQVYLRILCIQLTKSSLSGSLWRQLKGRILTKFTPKRMKELTEAGLQNCFSIFLTIALCTSVGEVRKKVCDFAELMQAISGNIKRQFVAWKALFALMFIHQEQSENLNEVASKTVQLFNNCCKKYALSSKDPMAQNNIMNLLLVYIENVDKIFDTSDNLMNSEHLLIDSGFTTLLPACTNELNFVLNILLNVLFCTIAKTDRVNNETHCIPLVKNLFEYVFPFVENHVTTNTPSLQLADLAVTFTCLTIKYSGLMANLTSVHTCVSLFNYFANGQNVNPVISVHYLNVMLHQQDVQVGQKSISIRDFHVVENLKQAMPNFHVVLIQAWIKSSVCLAPPSIQAQTLTKYIFQLDEVKHSFPDIRHVDFSSSHHDFLSIRLFKIMGETYQNGSMYEKKILKEKIQLYFSNIPSIISLQMENRSAIALMDHVYKLIGHLVEYCAPSLYIKTNYSVLQKLIDMLLLPHKTFPKDEFLPTILSKQIRNYLHLFVTGILKLDSDSRPFVRRILKEIIYYYLDKISNKHDNYPLMNIYLSAATKSSPSSDQNEFRFLVEILKEIIVNSNAPSITGSKFFIEVLKNISLSSKKEACQILMCDLSMLKFEGAVAPPIENLLKILFCFMENETDISYQKSVLLPLCNKVLKQLAWSHFKVFRFFEYIARNCVEVIVEFVPFIVKEIECIENKRGSGVETSLRKELKTLTSELTNKNANK